MQSGTSLKVVLFVLSLAVAILTDRSSAGAQTSGSFKRAGNMITSRALHTATLLDDGRVLIVGGETQRQDASSSAELYDPEPNSFAATAGSMTTARTLHTATLLNDGKVLITGGRNNGGRQILNSAELYDPARGTFTPTGNLTVPRVGHTATLLHNGQVLIAGGWTSSPPYFSVNSAELYDPLTGTFSPTADMSVNWFGSTATALPDGNVLIATAYDIDADAEVYDRVTRTFTYTPRVKCCGFYYWHAAALLPNGTVLITGGGDADMGWDTATAGIYDPRTGRFTPTSNMTTKRILHTATVLPDHTILITGGASCCGFDVKSAEVYDPSTGAFNYVADMMSPRTLHTATLLNNGKVLIAGGRTTPSPAATAELYVPGVLVPMPVVADLKFDRSTAGPGSSYSVNVSGSNLTDQTFFDVRFTAADSYTSDVVLNWQKGFAATHGLPADTTAGVWTITGVRPHEIEMDHTGNFFPVSATITVSPH